MTLTGVKERKPTTFTLTKGSKRQLYKLYGGQFTLSTQVTKPNDLVIPQTESVPRFLQKLTPFIENGMTNMHGERVYSTSRFSPIIGSQIFKLCSYKGRLSSTLQ